MGNRQNKVSKFIDKILKSFDKKFFTFLKSYVTVLSMNPGFIAA